MIERIAQAVATLIFPTITTVVDTAMAAYIDQIRKELTDQTRRVTEAECHISVLENELCQNNDTLQQHSQIHAIIQVKLEDLENRSCNNLQIIGLPEASTLLHLCASRLPESLGLTN